MNKVTQAQIDMLIDEADVQVSTMYDKCVYISVKLRNGFVLSESSCCVDPKNFDFDLGFDICMERIKDKLWMLEGYVLQKVVAGEL